MSSGTIRPVQIADTDAPVADPHAIRVVALDEWRCEQHAALSVPGSTSQLTGLVRAIRTAAAGTPAPDRPWQPPLPERLALAELPTARQPDEVIVGLVDLPADQRRAPLRFDLARGGSMLIVGAPRSGRTTALRSLAAAADGRLFPDDLHIHAIDLVGDLIAELRELPGAGTLVGPDDGIDLAADLLDVLHREVAERRLADTTMPRLLLLVDGWPQLVQAAEQFDGGRILDQLLALARDATAARLTVAVAGDRTALSARVAAPFGVRLLMRLAERNDYGLAGIAPAAVPRSMPPGRALLAPDGAGVTGPVQVQFARSDATVQPSGGRHRRRSSATVRVRALPTMVRLAALPAPGDELPFAVSAPLDTPVALPLSRAGCVVVGGPGRSGRTTTLLVLMRQARRSGTAVAVAANRRSALRAAAEADGVACLDPDECDATALDGADLVLVDDAELFVDRAAEPALIELARAAEPDRPFVAAIRTSDLATAYRGLPAELRRFRTGLLLHPQPGDGDLLGVCLPRLAGELPPGRGCLVGAADWTARPVRSTLRVQVATL